MQVRGCFQKDGSWKNYARQRIKDVNAFGKFKGHVAKPSARRVRRLIDMPRERTTLCVWTVLQVRTWSGSGLTKEELTSHAPTPSHS